VAAIGGRRLDVDARREVGQELLGDRVRRLLHGGGVGAGSESSVSSWISNEGSLLRLRGRKKPRVARDAVHALEVIADAQLRGDRRDEALVRDAELVGDDRAGPAVERRERRDRDAVGGEPAQRHARVPRRELGRELALQVGSAASK